MLNREPQHNLPVRGDDVSTLGRDDAGVAGNSRLTGMAGAVIFVLLAIEGFTIRGVGGHLTLHVFIGMMLIPLIVLKTASTGYRIVRYYRGIDPYVRRGAPPLLLRVLGPFVVVLSIAVVGTGILAIVSGRGTRWLQIHKLTFIAWFVVMTVHVLGHFIETTHLAVADVAGKQRISGGTPRVLVIVTALLLGIALGIGTRGLVDNWQHHRFEKFGDLNTRVIRRSP
jgi:hypothetical protein